MTVKQRQRVLSGIQPSGTIHLGNYFAMMRRMVRTQSKADLFCFVADYHALTSLTNKADAALLSSYTQGLVIDFLAIGLDPEKSTFWLQSACPQVTELAWLLSSHVRLPQLQLAHSYKAQLDRKESSPLASILYYPILMAADILAFGTHRVPVGKDQEQHLEVCRDIASRFNRAYGECFIMPEADIQPDLSIVPGIDGRKMSKSYKNAIYPLASEKEIKKAVMSIVTDSKGIHEAKDFQNSTLYAIYSLFLKGERAHGATGSFCKARHRLWPYQTRFIHDYHGILC